jgi:hypothetical protein
MTNFGKIEQALTVIDMLDLRGVFNLKSGLAEEILRGESDIEKIKFLLYLQGNIFTSELSEHEKNAYLGAFTLFMNIIVHGEIDDSEYEKFQSERNLH